MNNNRIAEIEALEALRNLHINDTHKGMKLSVVLTHAAVAIHEQAAKDAEIERLEKEKQAEFEIATGYYNKWQKAAAEIARLTEARRWIPVTERLPEDYAIVQIVEDNGYKWLPRIGEYRKCLDEWRIEGAFENSNGWLEDTKMFKVTHWQPLPEPPTKGE